MQDDLDDPNQQLARQASIYQNGTITILGGASASAQDGFLRNRNKTFSRLDMCVKLPSEHGHKNGIGNIVWLSTDFLLPDASKDPVASRAWIFQESTQSQYQNVPRDVQADLL